MEQFKRAKVVWIKPHLYIISNDEIKKGDWKYDTKLNIVIQHRSYTDGCKKSLQQLILH